MKKLSSASHLSKSDLPNEITNDYTVARRITKITKKIEKATSEYEGSYTLGSFTCKKCDKKSFATWLDTVFSKAIRQMFSDYTLDPYHGALVHIAMGEIKSEKQRDQYYLLYPASLPLKFKSKTWLDPLIELIKADHSMWAQDHFANLGSVFCEINIFYYE